jgi:LacI family transcriptional regulator
MDNDRPGVREVAKLAGVSIATVSRVYRGVGQVSPATREKVSLAIAQSGYRPSHLGAALSNRKFDALGIVFPGLSGPYFGELIEGFDEVALESGSSVNILGAHRRQDTTAELEAMAERVDGIAVHAGVFSAEVIKKLSLRIPIVVIGGEDSEGAVQVRSDHSEMRSLVRHLLDVHGRTKLAFLGRPEDSPDIAARWHEFEQAHLDSGLAAPHPPIPAGLQQSDGAMAAPGILELMRTSGLNGVVCANDEGALGLIMALLGQGVRVPEDLAVTGVDDVPLAALVHPGLTTLHRPLRDMAATTARTLLALINGDEVPHTTIVPSRVVLRRSCGCTPVAGPGEL